MPTQGGIGIVGGGPAGLVLAIGLARRGLRVTVVDRDRHPKEMPRYSPDRSYTIDISGHGRRAIEHIGATAEFDRRMLPFKGIVTPRGRKLDAHRPGWTGARGDIMRSLTAMVDGALSPLVTRRYETLCTAADVGQGGVTLVGPSGEAEPLEFDLLVAADGAGSKVREAMVSQIPGLRVERKSLPNYCTMLELDRALDRLDPHYLHGLSIAPFCAAGAIPGDAGPESARWFCAVGTKGPRTYASADEARRYFSRHVPRILDFASDQKLADFAARPTYHIGQKLTVSQLAGGKAVLIGDAAGPFPPIGQGVNAAMESAMVLDEEIGRHGADPAGLLAAARSFGTRWKPEVDAVSWMSEKSLFENRFHMLRVQLATLIGANMFEEAKSDRVPYSEVKRRADRFWPLWV